MPLPVRARRQHQSAWRTPTLLLYALDSFPTPEPVRAIRQLTYDQTVLIEALTHPECYPHPATTVEHLQTHISHILLAGAYAYKIKKPLNLGFLDFTSLQRRHYYCTEELRLNRRLAPELYLDCVSISGEPTHPVLGVDAGDASNTQYGCAAFPRICCWTGSWPPPAGTSPSGRTSPSSGGIPSYHSRR